MAVVRLLFEEPPKSQCRCLHIGNPPSTVRFQVPGKTQVVSLSAPLRYLSAESACFITPPIAARNGPAPGLVIRLGGLFGRAAAPARPPRPDSEVVAGAKRRTFAAQYKLRIPAEPDAAATQPVATGAWLRPESLYSSPMVNWRRERQTGMLKGLTPPKRGPRLVVLAWPSLFAGQEAVLRLNRDLGLQLQVPGV